jgi:hypothetical protein
MADSDEGPEGEDADWVVLGNTVLGILWALSAGLAGTGAGVAGWSVVLWYWAGVDRLESFGVGCLLLGGGLGLRIWVNRRLYRE